MNQSKTQKNKNSGFADAYLEKSVRGKQLIESPPDNNLKYIVVIPAFDESGLIGSLDSLFNCDRITPGIEVIIVINYPYGSDDITVKKNLRILEEGKAWAKIKSQPGKKFYFLVACPPDKKNSGVGFARKTGMDEAVSRFNETGRNDGIILSLDADARVDKNYFTAIDIFHRKNEGTDGFNIYYEHPLQGGFEDEIYEAVAQYELHLRYYVQSLRHSGHPNAFHTVGSSFGVKAQVYCEQGGMNKRQAGEDFYFLQKIFDLGNFSECNTTRVFPSPRPSERVVFGTGPVVKKYLETKEELCTNHPGLFEILGSFLHSSGSFYQFTLKNDFRFIDEYHPLLKRFLLNYGIKNKFREIAGNSSGQKAFTKRFFRWFNMFMALKFLNHGKSHFADIPVTKAAEILLRKNKSEVPSDLNAKTLLEIYRKTDRSK